MKYCYHCGHMTPGEPLFCNSCGRTYDVKLCHAKHSNPRTAEVCSQCGSRDFSTPQPRVPIWTRGFVLLLKAAIALLSVYLGLAFLVALLKGLLASPRILDGVLSIAILAGVLSWLWQKLPQCVRTIVRRIVGRKGASHGR